MKKFLSLPFLPPSKIYTEFDKLKAGLESDHVLLDFLSYFEKTYIKSKIFEPENWSIYKMLIRTNNGIESWHSKIKRKCGKNPGLKKFFSEIDHDLCV